MVSYKYQSVRGMRDILMDETPSWSQVDNALSSLVHAYGYDEIKLPILESTDLFKRSIGDATDIVEKEMYTFEDKNGDRLTLRPEGTASCIRAGIQHGFLHNQIQRLWYKGPMFRHERPQKGRYRQFEQFGMEAFGMAGIAIEAEMILIAHRLWKLLGIQDDVKLHINNLGHLDERKRYREALVTYLKEHRDELDEDSQRRLATNPLRVLDSKNPAMQTIITDAPRLWDYLETDTQNAFSQLTGLLDEAGVAYQMNHRLVRGLDYYNHLVFEWQTDKLGAQGTICAGGRYDGLVAWLGGQDTSAVGFAIGLDRVVALLSHKTSKPVDIFVATMDDVSRIKALSMIEQLRTLHPLLKIWFNCGTMNLKKQLKLADKMKARYALLLGADELAKGEFMVKDMSGDQPQCTIGFEELLKKETALFE